ncbi:hypothetical protein SDC9_50926 [bioreactor metagenome]|uniref:DUF4878 domain-containing protein n=1 Tax=bioreactor metagenome TaxID=1076179 RepID=A0A644WM39_9ZZZZ
MKKYFFVAITIIAVYIISSCHIQSKKPEYIAEKFLKYISNKEFANAEKLSTGDALKTVRTLEAFESIVELDSIDTTESIAPVIENINCIVSDKKATCTYNQDGRQGSIELQNVKGHWLVSKFPKETSSSNSDQDVQPVEEYDTTDYLIYNDSAAYLTLTLTDTSNLFGFAKIGFEMTSLYFQFIDTCWFLAEMFDKNGKQIGAKQLTRFDYLYPEDYSAESVFCYGINTFDISEIRLTPVSLIINEEKRDFIPSTLTISDNDFGIKVTIKDVRK